jgi:hypothetical protein
VNGGLIWSGQQWLFEMIERRGTYSRILKAMYEYLDQHEAEFSKWVLDGKPGMPWTRPCLVYVMATVKGANAKIVGQVIEGELWTV